MDYRLVFPRSGTAALFAISCAIVFAPGFAHADLIADEPFVYTAGTTVDGQTGGTGWSGGWITGQASFFTASAAIAGAPAIGATGGAMRVSGSGRIFRVIDTSPGSPAAVAGLVQSHPAMFFGTIPGIGAPGTTVWVGVLVTGGSGLSGDETQYHLYDGARTDASSLAMGDLNKDGETVAMLRGGSVAQWGFERTCAHSTCASSTVGGFFATSPSVPFGGTHWSVTRFVFGATSTQITMWRDPAPGPAPPADTAALLLTPFGGGTAAQTISVPPLFFNTVAPNASGDYGYAVDEIRITTTFAELGGATGPVDGGVPTDAGTTGTDAGTIGMDAGTSGTDAGTPASDGGPPGSDSGTPAGDGGLPSDGGGVRVDGSPDAGVGTSGSGCGCSAAGTGRGGRLVAAAAFVLAALGARRRRRR